MCAHMCVVTELILCGESVWVLWPYSSGITTYVICVYRGSGHVCVLVYTASGD